MFKRLRWMLLGAGFGAGTSFWVMRTVRAKIQRYMPERVAAEMTDAVRTFGADVRAAAVEGREAMRTREAELRTELARRRMEN